MDTPSPRPAGDFIAVSGTGCEVSADVRSCLTGAAEPWPGMILSHDCQPLEYLPSRKALKFMSKQDRLAVAAAGRALQSASLTTPAGCAGAGVFLCVGYLPFEQAEAESLCANSVRDGRFSMEAFTTEAYRSINPIRAFTCLPNMPAHHLAASFGIQGEYFITYPGTPQFYLALQEAWHRLQDHSISLALAGGIADQTNFLTALQYTKQNYGRTVYLADAAAFLVLEREADIRRRGQVPLCRLELSPGGSTGSPAAILPDPVELGPALLPVKVASFLAGNADEFAHEDPAGTGLRSTWRRLSPSAGRSR